MAIDKEHQLMICQSKMTTVKQPPIPNWCRPNCKRWLMDLYAGTCDGHVMDLW